MKYIKQISTGFAVHREEPHTDKTLSNASVQTKIPLTDLQVINDSTTEVQWNQKCEDAKPWIEKIADTDAGMPRFAEDILDGMPNKLSVAKITLDRLQTKKDLRATKP
jgi:hypothetical protein